MTSFESDIKIDMKSILKKTAADVKKFAKVIEELDESTLDAKKLKNMWNKTSETKFEVKESGDKPKCQFHFEGNDEVKKVECAKNCKKKKGKNAGYEPCCASHMKFAFEDDFTAIRCDHTNNDENQCKSFAIAEHTSCKKHTSSSKKPSKVKKNKKPKEEDSDNEEEEEEGDE